jgi:hypothetical protein
MNDVLRTQMLACTEACVNALVCWTRDHPDADLDQREEQVLHQGRLLMTGLLTLVAVAAAPRTPGRCPHCAAWPADPVVRPRPRTVLSRVGLLHLMRALVTCAGCGYSWYPLDRVLGLQPYQRLTRGVRQWLVELGVDLPFRRAARRLWSLTGLTVGAETIRTQTEAVGQALEAAQQAAIRRVARTQEAAEPLDPAPGQLVVETDGVMVHFLDGWHEVKLGVIAGYADGTLRSPSYVAAQESAEQFGPRLLAEAARRGALEVVAWRSRLLAPGLALLRRVAVLGDGAVWIWHLAADHFGERIEIIDFYHASEHIWELARAFYGDNSPKAKRWAERQCRRLLKRGPQPLRRALRAAHPRQAAVAKLLRRERGYFQSNAARMDYPAFREQGLPIGSGAVESAAGHVVQQRLKRTAGMRWSQAGGTALLALRAYEASGRAFSRFVSPRPLRKVA